MEISLPPGNNVDPEASLARIEEDISEFDSIFEFPLDSPSRRAAPTNQEDEGNYSSEEVFQRLENDARRVLCASHSIEEEELGSQDGSCMSNTILRGEFCFPRQPKFKRPHP